MRYHTKSVLECLNKVKYRVFHIIVKRQKVVIMNMGSLHSIRPLEVLKKLMMR